MCGTTMQPIDPGSETVPSLAALLGRLALDLAEAQAALDAQAEAEAARRAETESPLPTLAFYFPRVEVELRIAITLTRRGNGIGLAVMPANPKLAGFFQTASFSSSLRAVIAPRSVLLSPTEKGEDAHV
jgi:hypothetical protein